MTKELNQAWINDDPPFHGETLISYNALGLNDFLRFGYSLVNLFGSPYEIETFTEFDDWHMHDGFLTESTEAPLSLIKEKFLSSEQLITWLSDDDYVFKSLFLKKIGLLFRFWYFDNPPISNGKKEYFCFTCTGYGRELHEIIKIASDHEEIRFERMNSKIYFNKIFAGRRN